MRTSRLLGEEAQGTLQASRVAVFGIGGVGGYVCEALARAGVGAFSLFDGDVVEESNLNRQIIALHSTLGQPKVDVMKRRILDINPDCAVATHRVFYLPEVAGEYPFEGYNYVVDAVDTVSAKIEIIARAKEAGVPVISAMGTGNKLHPECFFVAEIEDTRVCPLARVMRKELKKRGIEKVQVVCSQEPPQKRPDVPVASPGDPSVPRWKDVPGSVSFVPGAAGLVLAGAVVRGLLGLDENARRAGGGKE